MKTTRKALFFAEDTVLGFLLPKKTKGRYSFAEDAVLYCVVLATAKHVLPANN